MAASSSSGRWQISSYAGSTSSRLARSSPTGRASGAPLPRTVPPVGVGCPAHGAPVGARTRPDLLEHARHLESRGRRLPALVRRTVARAGLASSSELVVSTPKVIGTPVAPIASARPWATADAMYSKCGVSPRMMQPRQTTAANRPVRAARARRAESQRRRAHRRPRWRGSRRRQPAGRVRRRPAVRA